MTYTGRMMYGKISSKNTVTHTYTIIPLDGNPFVILEGDLIRGMSKGLIVLSNAELMNGEIVELGHPDNSKENFMEYMKLCKVYHDKYPKKVLKELIENYLGKLELLGISIDIKFEIINDKVFISKVFPKEMGRVVIDIPDFVFGFVRRAQPEFMQSVRDYRGCFTFIRNTDVVINFTNPVVCTRYAIDIHELRSERDEFNNINGGLFANTFGGNLELHDFRADFCNLDNMFCYTELNSLKFTGNTDISKCRSAYGMFSRAKIDKWIDFGDNFNAKNLVTVETMFYGLRGTLDSINLGDKFNTSRVISFNDFFGSSNRLSSIELGKSFSLKNAVYINNMFSSIYNIDIIHLKSKDKSNRIVDIANCFSCSGMHTILIDTNIDLSNVISAGYFVYFCDNLRHLRIGKIDFKNKIKELFNETVCLISITFPKECYDESVEKLIFDSPYNVNHRLIKEYDGNCLTIRVDN